ncbi:hypothetical protein B0H10DRAFT_1731849, partial [Mycena sp. CBHHK59/15]
EIPSLMVLCISVNNLRLNEELNFQQQNRIITLKLWGLIYHSQLVQVGHFTSVILDAEGVMWYHDGITTGRTCINNGRFSEVQDLLMLHRRSQERLCAV